MFYARTKRGSESIEWEVISKLHIFIHKYMIGYIYCNTLMMLSATYLQDALFKEAGVRTVILQQRIYLYWLALLIRQALHWDATGEPRSYCDLGHLKFYEIMCHKRSQLNSKDGCCWWIKNAKETSFVNLLISSVTSFTKLYLRGFTLKYWIIFSKIFSVWPFGVQKLGEKYM